MVEGGAMHFLKEPNHFFNLLSCATCSNKIRAGDILDTLTANTNLPGKQIGKIDILDILADVAVERPIAIQALKILSEEKIKGRRLRVRKLR